MKDILRAAGPPALSAALRDLSPEKVKSLIRRWNADLSVIYFIGSIQQAAFYVNGFRLSGLDSLFAYICFLVVLYLVVHFCAQHNGLYCQAVCSLI